MFLKSNKKLQKHRKYNIIIIFFLTKIQMKT